MHDIFACSQSLHKQVHDCVAVLEGVDSNHRAVRLKIMLSSIKFKARAISRGTIDWPKILTNEHLQMVYNKHLQSMSKPNMDYNEYNNIILNAGELTTTTHKRTCAGWFQMSRSMLAPLLSDSNKILHCVRQASHLSSLIQATMKAGLVCLNCHVALTVSHAKAKYYANICAKIHDMQMNPLLAWEHIRLLTKGETAHHSKSTAMTMKLPDGTRATNASENMSVFSPHLHKVYNTHRPTDPSILEHVSQRCTMWELDDPINWNEFSQAVRKLKNAKAAGLTGVPPEAFKAMQTANRLHIFKYINDFFLGAADYNQWH
jgi:hypothetical protein